MNEFKGTPGPWELGIPEQQGEGLHVPIHGIGHGELAMVVWQMADDKFDRIRSVSCEANAALIAAAPELLKALMWYVQNDDVNIGMLGNEFWEDGLHAAEAAIAKALGESK